MAIGLKKPKSYLNGEHCFRLWMEENSINKVLKKLSVEGVVNPTTNKAPTAMGVWTSAWLYVLSNMVEGRRAANDAWKKNGEILTDPIWYKLVANKAKYLLTKKKFIKFIDDHSYLRPYV